MAGTTCEMIASSNEIRVRTGTACRFPILGVILALDGVVKTREFRKYNVMRIPSSLTFIFIGLLAATSVMGQNLARDLNGFRLGQLREATHKELGPPDKAENGSDGIYYEAFLMSEEPMLYMVFQYQESDPEIIWSIQITGNNKKHDPLFRGLRLGQSPAEVEKLLGKPSKKHDVEQHGTRWEYDGRNFSVEINPQNKLSSIRIVNDRKAEPDMKKVPKLADVAKKLQTAPNADLADMLAPDLEVYDSGKVLSFRHSINNEIANDKSGVFESVRRLSKELSQVDTIKSDQYEELTNLRQGRDPLHVAKLWKLKGVTEITYAWDGERWLIWEFGAKPQTPPPADWRSIYKPGTLKALAETRVPELIKNPNVAMSKSDGKPLASFSYNSYPTATSVKFTGERRKVAESTTNLIGIWLTTLGKQKDLAKRFEYEYKFVESGTEYCLPVQNPLPERMAAEIKAGDEVTIYLSWLGINYESGKPDLLVIVNEFERVTK